MDFPEDVVSDQRTPAYCDMLRLMRAVAGAVGAEWHLGRTLRGLLEAAGFTDIGEEDVVLNIGRTNKDEGLAREGAETCSIAVQGLSRFAQSKPLHCPSCRVIIVCMQLLLLRLGHGWIFAE